MSRGFTKVRVLGPLIFLAAGGVSMHACADAINDCVIHHMMRYYIPGVAPESAVNLAFNDCQPGIEALAVQSVRQLMAQQTGTPPDKINVDPDTLRRLVKMIEEKMRPTYIQQLQRVGKTLNEGGYRQ